MTDDFPPTPRQIVVKNSVWLALPQYKTLTQFGFANCDKRYAAIQDIEINYDEVETCIRWINLFSEKITRRNKEYSSYYLKHRVEDFGRVIDQPTYVCNGSFIAAMMVCGYKAWPCDDNSPNAHFNAKYLQHNFRKN